MSDIKFHAHLFYQKFPTRGFILIGDGWVTEKNKREIALGALMGMEDFDEHRDKFRVNKCIGCEKCTSPDHSAKEGGK